jgi:hypothetical protein
MNFSFFSSFGLAGLAHQAHQLWKTLEIYVHETMGLVTNKEVTLQLYSVVRTYT